MATEDALLLELEKLVAEDREYKLRTKFYRMFPPSGPLGRQNYPRHLEFLTLGATTKERLLMAPNRAGKTVLGAFEVTCHATGLYPDWWPGYRFRTPVDVWAAGKTSQTTIDVIQKELFGGVVGSGHSKRLSGYGMVPGDLIGDVSYKVGYPDLVDTVCVKHVSGGWSHIGLKQYEQGRGSFEGTSKHVIWFDEEPPAEVYTEALTRTATTEGLTIITFTPLEGWSTIVKMFKSDDCPAHRAVVGMTWDDVPHLSQNQKDMLYSSYLPHERDARTKGIPSLGSGAVYPVAESEVVIDPVKLQPFWKRFYAMDVGWNRTAALWCAHDTEADIIYVYSDHYVSRSEPSIHADAIKARGDWMRGVIDPASRGRSQHDGEQLISIYRDLGLNITPAKNAVESGIYEVWMRLSTGRLKIFNNCLSTIAEIRLYRRDNKGHIVKVDDHLMDCLRYGIVSGIDVADFVPDAASRHFGAKSGFRSANDPKRPLW